MLSLWQGAGQFNKNLPNPCLSEERDHHVSPDGALLQGNPPQATKHDSVGSREQQRDAPTGQLHSAEKTPALRCKFLPHCNASPSRDQQVTLGNSVSVSIGPELRSRPNCKLQETLPVYEASERVRAGASSKETAKSTTRGSAGRRVARGLGGHFTSLPGECLKVKKKDSGSARALIN